jgi:hypothetical protein
MMCPNTSDKTHCAVCNVQTEIPTHYAEHTYVGEIDGILVPQTWLAPVCSDECFHDFSARQDGEVVLR